MAEVANKTILVPVLNETNSLTSFNQEKESYTNFKNTTVSRAYARDSIHENIYEGSENPFLSFSSDIFKQINNLQNSYDIGSIEEIRNGLINDITYFTNASGKKGVENSQVMLARYILCTFSDEIICTTYWGKDTNWANSSLLGHFYNETYGGDKFFQILDKLLRAPAKYLDLLELMYICLSLGFEGKYKIQNRGKMELDSLRESLYRQMKMMQIRKPQNFYSVIKPSLERNHLIYKTSYQLLALIIAIMLSLVYGGLTFSLVKKEDKALVVFQKKYNDYINEKHVSPTLTQTQQNIFKYSKTVTAKDTNE